MRRVLASAVAVLALASCSATPAPVPRSRPFYGLDEPYASAPRERSLSHDVGERPDVFSVFIRLDTTTTAGKMATLRRAGLTPFVTLEPWHLGSRSGTPDARDSLRRLLAGAFDRELTAQARMLATYRAPFYLRFAHEMNANWYPWAQGVRGNTAAEYVRAWRHIHRLFAAVDGLAARWVWSPVAVQNPGAVADLAPLYPGDDVVDYAGLTGYEHDASDPAVTFDPTVTRLRAVTRRPLLLSEIGCDAAGKAMWLAALGPYLRRRRDIVGFVYFDTSPATTGATGRYDLDHPTDRAALRRTLRVLHTLPSGKDNP